MASPMCGTCLAHDRWLKPLQSFVPEKYATSWMKYGVTPETMVCWECQANMLRIARFTAQVVRAQSTLRANQNPQIHKSKTAPALKSMSRLAIRATIQVGTDQVVDNDNECTILSDDEDTNTTQSKNNKILPQPETGQVTGDVNIDPKTQNAIYKRSVAFINTNSQTVSKIPPNIKVRDFANSSDIPETSNAPKLLNDQFNFQANNSISAGGNFIFIPENNSNCVTLIPGQYMLSNSAVIGPAQPSNSAMIVPAQPMQQATNLMAVIGIPKVNQESLVSDLVQQIKTEYDITGVSAPQNTLNGNTVSGIKIDNVMSLNPNSNSWLDKYNINPMVTYNINMKNKQIVNNVPNQFKNRPSINKPTGEDVKTNIFTLTETPVAVISNPIKMSEDTLDFEDNIPVTKIISEDSSRTAKPQLLVKALLAKPKVIETYKENCVKEPDKHNKSDEKDKQHTVYSKSFESYISKKSNEREVKHLNIDKNKTTPKPNPEKSKAQSKYLLKLLDYKQVMTHRELNRQHKEFKSKQYKCESCVMGWNLEAHYNIHVQRYHFSTPGTVFVCEICSCQFNKREIANDHFNKHFNVFACRTCEFTHYDISKINRHECDPSSLQNHVNNGSTKSIEVEAVDDVTISKNNQRVDNVVEIMDDSDSETNDLFVPMKKKKKKNNNPKPMFQNCAHCGIFKSDLEAHMKRKHPELIRLKANFKNK